MFLEQIKPKLSDLCSTIKLFPCPTSKHRLCQSEISQKLAFIIRSFYATSANSDEDPCALMRLALEKLPLSQEFARQELRHVLTAFLKEKLTIN
jgi:nuclear pore complex protein Nup98-Nup96